MGITQANVINHGAGVDLARPSRSSAKAAVRWQGMAWSRSWSGMGDQNSVYANRSLAVDSTSSMAPARQGIFSWEHAPNVMSSQGVMAPDSSTTGAVSAALKATPTGRLGRGWRTSTPNRAGLRRQDGGADSGSDLKSQLVEAMAMPTNTFRTDCRQAPPSRHQQGHPDRRHGSTATT